MQHKYQHRQNLKVVFFSTQGKEIFDKSPEKRQYEYMGTVTDEEKEAEEKEIHDAQLQSNKTRFEKPKREPAKVVELTDEEKEKLNQRKTKIKDDEEDMDKIDEDDDDEDDDEKSGKLAKDKAKLKDKTDGKTK